jgi:hypothetical protein
VEDDGGMLFINAGTIKLEWSRSRKGGCGWIYYRPEEIRVQIANAKEFEKIKLQRFARREKW